MSRRWFVRFVRWGPGSKGTWGPRAADGLCAKVTGAPVRAHMTAGRLVHPEGAATETVIGHVVTAWASENTDGVLGVIELDDTPRARAVDRGMRRMAARGLLEGAVGCSLVAQVRFGLEHPSLPIVGVDSVVAVDLVYPPAAGGWVIRALEPGEDPSQPAEREAPA